ncbi:MAG TPA: DUF4262 domain-containing protein [Phycisphaerae bacterium]|nr:DUF4262 domain-containing protein [Phycisphaerae bacterium]
MESHGYHVYLITGKQSPRFAYTIGIHPTVGAELVFAGAAAYSNEEVRQIIVGVAEGMSRLRLGVPVELGPLGTFILRNADPSWAETLMLGALDYYGRSDIQALQIVPDRAHWTLDIPDLSRARTVESEPVWQWLTEPWTYEVSDRSVVVTNMDALKGSPATEVMRWEIDQWEMFAGAGPDVEKHEIRQVPLGTLLGADPSLQVAIKLETGKGLWRNPDNPVWHNWETSNPRSSRHI